MADIVNATQRIVVPNSRQSVVITGFGGTATVSPEQVEAAVNTALSVHILDPTPHPPYDDLPSLVLLFENGLV